MKHLVLRSNVPTYKYITVHYDGNDGDSDASRSRGKGQVWGTFGLWLLVFPRFSLWQCEASWDFSLSIATSEGSPDLCAWIADNDWNPSAHPPVISTYCCWVLVIKVKIIYASVRWLVQLNAQYHTRVNSSPTCEGKDIMTSRKKQKMHGI
jgi:hypothetical protein